MVTSFHQSRRALASAFVHEEAGSAGRDHRCMTHSAPESEGLNCSRRHDGTSMALLKKYEI